MPRRNNPIRHVPFRFDARQHTKRQFLTERDAQKAADLQMLAQPRLELTVYKCDICGKWHLTSKSKNSSQATR